jgi:hypothetical protein
MLKLAWPKRVSSSGGIYMQKDGKSNISDTQSAVFEYDGFNVIWQHRTWGAPADPDYPWALFIYDEKGTLKASTMRADFIPFGNSAKPIHFDCVFEREKYPEDVTEADIELNAAPATRRHMLDFLGAIDKAQPACGGHCRRSYLDGELHPGESGIEAGTSAELRRDTKTDDRRCRSDAIVKPAVSRALGTATNWLNRRAVVRRPP